MSQNLPIKEISTYCGRNWQFVARVTLKSAMRAFNSAAKKGQLFSVDLLDKDGGEIRGTLFNRAAEKFFPLLEQGKVYRFGKGTIKVANKTYSTLKHNYEITFEEESLIEEVTESPEVAQIDTEMRFNFTRIRDLSTRSMPCTVDLIGVVRDSRPAASIQTKTGDSLMRKLITLVDSSGCAIDVTLFGDHASTSDETILHKIIALKGLSVKEYNNARSAATLASTIIVLDPLNLPESADLSVWFLANKDTSFLNLSASSGRNSLGGAPGGPAGTGKECDLATLREDCQFIPSTAGLAFSVHSALLVNVSTRSKDQELPVFYAACPTCNRKLVSDACLACDKQVSVPNLRFLLRAQFADYADDCYLSVFHDQAGILVNGLTPQTLAEHAGEKLKNVYLKKIFNLKVRATTSEYKGEIKPKITVVHCELTDFKTDAHRMLKLVNNKIGEVGVGAGAGKRKIDEISNDIV